MLPESAKRILAPYFPDFDLDEIRIREGIPWYVLMKAAAYADRNCIYFAPGVFNPHSPEGLALIGHEIVHCLQYKQFGKWRFRALYLWASLSEFRRRLSFDEAYSNNRFERAARVIEYRIYSDLSYGAS